MSNSERMFPISEWWDKEYEPKDIPRKKYSKGDKVLVIDGDILAYKVSAATEKRTVVVTNPKGKTKGFKTKTEFLDWCKQREKSPDQYTIEAIQTPESIDFCLGTMKRAIENIKKRVGATHMEIYVEGSGNFRKTLPLIDLYKDRSSSVRPIHLKACKEYMLQFKDALRVSGRECDDFFQQRLYELSCDGIDSVGYSVDKDVFQNYQFELTIYNPDKEEINTYPKGVGKLWETSNGVKGYGMKWLVFQTLLFDRIDNYCMNQFYTKRYGEKSFYKDFKDLETEKDVLQMAVDKLKKLLPEVIEYKDCFGGDQKHNWLSLAELYFSCCYMRIANNDETTFESLLKEYEVEY